MSISQSIPGKFKIKYDKLDKIQNLSAFGDGSYQFIGN